jgi:hypothetical protein
MRTINKVLLGITLASAGFAAVGTGAGADFIDNSAASQTITSGTLSVSLSDGTHSSQGTATTPASLPLSAIGPTGSYFKDYKTVTATNTGNVTATVRNIQLTTTGDVTPLANDMHVSISGPTVYSSYVCSGTIAHCSDTNLTPGGSYVLAPGQSITLAISTYAGGNTGAPALTNVDEGKVLNEALTFTIAG